VLLVALFNYFNFLDSGLRNLKVIMTGMTNGIWLSGGQLFFLNRF
jgi:hypothetical protein